MKSRLLCKYFFSLSAVVIVLFGTPVHSQSDNTDIKDVVQKWKKAPPKPQLSLTVGKTYYSLLPVIGYAPANGFLIGAAVSLSRLFGEAPTNLSSGLLNGQFTTKKQTIINARSKIYLAENKWFLQGDWRLLLFTQPTYGLGIVNSKTEDLQLQVNNMEQYTISLSEPMKYDQIRIYEEVAKKLGNSTYYAGVGIAIDQHFNIVDEKLVLDTASAEFNDTTSHYTYSLRNGFDPYRYGRNGIKFTILTDTRDNLSNCYKGYYASLSAVYNANIRGNSKESMQVLYDARYYLGLSKTKPRHLVAFWSWGSFLLSGHVPYLALPSIGWDTYNRSGRGYIQGRYRGLSMVYNEAEYRFPISKNGLIGGTAFLNATTANDYGERLFEKNTFGLGAGIRIQLDKLARTNLTVDFGYGTDKSSGVYFNLQETF